MSVTGSGGEWIGLLIIKMTENEEKCFHENSYTPIQDIFILTTTMFFFIGVWVYIFRIWNNLFCYPSWIGYILIGLIPYMGIVGRKCNEFLDILA